MPISDGAMDTPRLDLPPTTAVPIPTCRHKRLVDRVLTENGEETGEVCCLECGAIIPDQTPAPAQ